MIRYRLKELIAEKSFQEGRTVTMNEVAEKTGIHRTTLTKIANQFGYNTSTDVLDKLCDYFNCELSDLAQRYPAKTA